MINLGHIYALLEDGTIEPLHYSWGELRDVYRDEDGTWYMDHDRWIGEGTICAYCHHCILATGNYREELEVLADGT